MLLSLLLLIRMAHGNFEITPVFYSSCRFSVDRIQISQLQLSNALKFEYSLDFGFFFIKEKEGVYYI